MKKYLSIISTTALLAGASFAPASAASMQEMMASMQAKMSCSASCSSEYNQCVADKSDYAPNVTNLIERTKMNMMAPVDCAGANRECNSSC